MFQEGAEMNKALETQVGGNHYKEMKIQPMEFCLANMTSEELVGVLKFNGLRYHWRKKKDMIEDFEKARQYNEIIVEELKMRGFSLESKTQEFEKNLFEFPVTRFAKTNSTMMQLNHIASECAEFIEALTDWQNTNKNYDHVLEELLDIMQSAQTYADIGHANYAELASAKQAVINKNTERGYYD